MDRTGDGRNEEAEWPLRRFPILIIGILLSRVRWRHERVAKIPISFARPEADVSKNWRRVIKREVFAGSEEKIFPGAFRKQLFHLLGKISRPFVC